MASDPDDELAVHLKSDHGLAILVSIATTPADDIDLQAQALRILSEHGHEPKVATAWEAADMFAYLLDLEALVDGEHDLHLAVWKCLAQCAETAVPLLHALWERRVALLAAATSMRDANLQSTSIAAHTLVALVCNMAGLDAAVVRTAPCFGGLGDAGDNGVGFCELVKQWFVLTNEAALLTMVGHLITSSADVKAVFASGLVRLACRDYVIHYDNFEFHHSCIAFLDAVASVVCPIDNHALLPPGRDTFTRLVLRLSLCKIKAVWSDMLCVLQHTAHAPVFSAHLLEDAHFRGAICYLAAKDPAAAEALTSMLPQLDALDRGTNNLIQLPELAVDLSLGEAVDAATVLKASGNAWFAAGNHTAARAFYRHALSTLAVADANASRRHTDAPTMDALSVGHCVKVQLANKTWLQGMVSDCNGRTVDVMFDNGSEEDDVPLHRVRLVPTEAAAMTELRLQLCMNSAKCLHALKQTHEAVECLGYALEHVPGHIPALYLRRAPISSCLRLMSCRAKDDLQLAHQLVAKTKTHVALAADIRTAWSRLQLIVKHRKRADKRLIKEMMAYLNTIVE
ncbi:Aste57867_22830 [Aphanomyces stellatus]|uniref:Aste57867_22830 protein n=1 Tax=Aphanomyces stellatus TaxID=120398 RepID=A0A485LMY7_9STRA|nr:hypothetical protein As57867_022759 [Aphanomyces stellatus]VFT99481.1 Aste57867_22830 [Aphanomyces stellatus]